MRPITSAEAEINFGELIDLARAAPVAVTKYDGPVIVVMAVVEHDQPKALEPASKASKRQKDERASHGPGDP